MQKVMIITGARKGIGRFLAEYYLSLNWKVYGCSREPSDLTNKNYIDFPLDVKDEARVKKLFNQVRIKEERLDVLINNAGIASMNHLLTTPVATVERIFNTNFIGTFIFMREAGKLMRNSGGRIINFTTVAKPLNLEGEAIYAASKAAIETLTRIGAREFSDFKITVNAIGPTPIETDLIKSVPIDKMTALLQRQSIKKLGNMKDVSNCIDFLIKEESEFITGQIIYLGGV
jgi:3-oxoacyl-[acyl-carrier protein] reductase